MKTKEIEEMRYVVKLALLKAGIRPDLIGFNYLAYAVELVIQEPNLINCLCKELYVRISKRFKAKNDYCIERSIRHAIETTLNDRGFSELNNMFKCNLYSEDKKPTSGELIRLIAEYYNLELYKKDNILNSVRAV